MKKVYAMSMALACSLSAMATPEVAMQREATLVDMSDAAMTISQRPEAQPAKVQVAKAISSTADLDGKLFKFSCVQTSQNDPKGNLGSIVKIEKLNDGKVMLANFPFSGFNTEAVFDAAKKTLSIKSNTYLGTINNGSVQVGLFVSHRVPNYDTNKYEMTNKESLDLAVGEDGTLTLPTYADKNEDDMLSICELNTSNYQQGYWFMSSLAIGAASYNVPNMNDFVSVGKAKFTDGWINPAFQAAAQLPANTEVEAFVKKGNNNIIVLKNPYASLSANVNKTEDGYLYIDATRSDFVQVAPMTYSGCSLDDSQAHDGSLITKYYPYNDEGMLVWGGGTEDDILDFIDDAEILGTELSNVNGKTISITSGKFGIENSEEFQPVGGYYWAEDQFTLMDFVGATIVMPETWSGVQGVVDVESAPVKYYNLQGMEVSAPVKGQLTIRKQGNKSTKFIGR